MRYKIRKLIFNLKVVTRIAHKMSPFLEIYEEKKYVIRIFNSN